MSRHDPIGDIYDAGRDGAACSCSACRPLAGQYGAERKVTENTLRTQVAHILRKTDTGSLRELVHPPSVLPPLR